MICFSRTGVAALLGVRVFYMFCCVDSVEAVNGIEISGTGRVRSLVL